MSRLIADNVWDGLDEYLRSGRPVRAAIAYVGGAAYDLLSLNAGDLIIVDGSDRVVSSGSVDPVVIAKWLDSGVEVRSLEGLHAKVLLIESEPPVVAVGSANASQNSRDHLLEAVVVTEDQGLCEQVREQLDVWWTRSDLIDAEWLSHARKIYRPPAPGPVKRRPSASPKEARPLWLGMSLPADVALSPSGRVAREHLVARHGDGSVHPWQMMEGDDRIVLKGHEVVLFDIKADQNQPHGNREAWPPATVARVVEGSEGAGPVALLVSMDDGQERLKVTFRTLCRALDEIGVAVNWEEPYLPESAAAATIRALWSTASK
ncbi:phospholipase D family protein [Longispora sp. NPDC051575]|uniref:phospholipase D family protein n=1 Tax=Longispora sp. NPDC051575 TaxID=3154943 RepID=UPI00343DE278